MNTINTNKNTIVEKDITVQFCKKFFTYANNNKCTEFLLNNIVRGKAMCPYGYSCARSVDTIYCGFVAKGYSDIKRIKGHNKFSNSKTIENISEDDYNRLCNIAEAQDQCSVFSQTAHDLIHFSGQLKSLIDEASHYSQQDNLINRLISEYRKYITLIDGYIKKSEGYSKLYNSTNDKTISVVYDYWNNKLGNYKHLIDSIADVSDRISKMLIDVQADEDYKGKYNLISLISMQSLFDYRIRFHRITLLEHFNTVKLDDSQFFKYNWHRISKKLTNMLSYQARAKNARFMLDGSTHDYFLSRESVYLALYILLENTIKYSNDTNESQIILHFEDKNDECILTITNPSEYISNESLARITEKGFSGENSNRRTSNGIGLFVVKKIFEDNNIYAAYSYNDGLFQVCIKAKKIDVAPLE